MITGQAIWQTSKISDKVTLKWIFLHTFAKVINEKVISDVERIVEFMN